MALGMVSMASRMALKDNAFFSAPADPIGDPAGVGGFTALPICFFGRICFIFGGFLLATGRSVSVETGYSEVSAYPWTFKGM